MKKSIQFTLTNLGVNLFVAVINVGSCTNNRALPVVVFYFYRKDPIRMLLLPNTFRKR